MVGFAAEDQWEVKAKEKAAADAVGRAEKNADRAKIFDLTAKLAEAEKASKKRSGSKQGSPAKAETPVKEKAPAKRHDKGHALSLGAPAVGLPAPLPKAVRFKEAADEAAGKKQKSKSADFSDHVSLKGSLPVAGVLSLADADMVVVLSQLSPEVTRVANVSRPNAEHMELGPI